MTNLDSIKLNIMIGTLEPTPQLMKAMKAMQRDSKPTVRYTISKPPYYLSR